MCCVVLICLVLSCGLSLVSCIVCLVFSSFLLSCLVIVFIPHYSTLFVVSTSCLLCRQKMNNIPENYKCSITKDIMTDPVTTTCGHTFEKGAITTWFRSWSTCPYDDTDLASKHLSPNFDLKDAIAKYVQNEPLLFQLTFAMQPQCQTDFSVAVQQREDFLREKEDNFYKRRWAILRKEFCLNWPSTASSSSPKNLADLLFKLGLSKYNNNFKDADVDLELLEELDDDLWKEVFHECKVPIGARLKIKKSVRELKRKAETDRPETPEVFSKKVMKGNSVCPGFLWPSICAFLHF
jgi:hypothetical protein